MQHPLKKAALQQSLAQTPSTGLVGVVLSDKMDKTIVVCVKQRYKHPEFEKVVTRSKKYYVHDEHNAAKQGNTVVIAFTRPLSRQKHAVLVNILR